MKRLFLFLFFSYQSITFSQTTKKYFQQKVNYKIEVNLNDAENTLNGFETIDYTNNSPDTLQYIWFHLWPDAYKNDRTAFSEQLLKLGRTDFYFSDEAVRGYINRLDFKVNNVTANLENHPQYIDVVKLILPRALAPGETIKITTPFHEKIPFNFSRGGHVGNTYQITQWYPKPAVYDNDGWHPVPYLDQGEFYSEFGNYDVVITVPQDYIIAATGEEVSGIRCQLSGKNIEQSAMINQQPASRNQQSAISKTISNQQSARSKKSENIKKQKTKNTKPKTSNLKPHTSYFKPDTSSLAPDTKTLHYLQNNIHDFAWFADKDFIVRHDTMKLASGRIINVNAYYTPAGKEVWKNIIQFMKDAIQTRSEWLGEYPYNTVTAVEAKMGFNGGMEYPTITSISPVPDERYLDMTIEHEVGHNWNYGVLATNERAHPWMDEGINTYFDKRYEELKYPVKNRKTQKDFLKKRIPDDDADLVYRTQVAEKKDQPVETSSENFSDVNYDAIAYYKTGLWMKELESFIGKNLFDSCLHEYYNRWKFKHPQPEDFEKVIEDVSKKNVKPVFSLLTKKGNLETPPNKEFKAATFFNFNNTHKYSYLFIAPAVGYNYYDKIMIGGILHNYTLPEPAFHFFAAPMYATASKTFTGIARIGYDFMSYGFIRKTGVSLSGEKFSMNEYTDSTGAKNYLGFSKIVPSIKLIFKNNDATSAVKKWIQWKTYFIRETGLLFSRDTARQTDIINYPETNRYLNQLTLAIENNRSLYPYSANVLAEQGKDFLRFVFEGKYFFNYAKGGGLDARIFAGKFIYLGGKTIYKQFETDRYHLNMTGANGYEDYTYSNYFIGRNEYQNFSSQQIMIRDGGFKVRTDLLNQKIGKTDDWLSALNLSTDFPQTINPLQVLPVKTPLKVFLDAGTYAEAWKNNAPTGKFIYDAGLQVSLLKGLVNIYVPVFYSKVYGHYFKSTIPKNKRFWNNISFSIDIQNFRLAKFINLPGL